MEVKLAQEKLKISSLANSSGSDSSCTSAKAFQAIKCKCSIAKKLIEKVDVSYITGIMTLKRKLKRIREGRGSEMENDNEDMNNE